MILGDLAKKEIFNFSEIINIFDVYVIEGQMFEQIVKMSFHCKLFFNFY